MAACLWFFCPRKPDLRRFDPVATGRLEADMWHCYYAKNYTALEWDLYLTARDQYGFSPWDSVRMAWHASLAAGAAQPVQSRAEAYAHALPDLQAYYGIIDHAVHLPSPVDDLARDELNWWVLRRESAGWKRYGQAISDLTARLYGVPEPGVHDSALLRAEMMDYRDQRRDGRMTPKDWQHIATRLGESYARLKEAVNFGSPM
jgi:hypothetical protein